MERHAYLIMAHNNFYVLEKLICMLDDDRNDIYLHIDKKVGYFDFNHYRNLVTKSKLIFTNERLDVRWGHVSLVKLEFLLFKTAFNGGEYTYFHLLSGCDLPIKSQDYIHHFFTGCDKEFIGFKEDELFDKSRVTKIHLFPSYFKYSSSLLGIFLSKFRSIGLRFQRMVCYNHLHESENFKYKKGSQWVSITKDCVKYILPYEESCLKMYRWAFCSDEIFLQTLIYNSPFREKVYMPGKEQLESCMRLINWKDEIFKKPPSSPSDFEMADKEIILHSNRLFARKFSDEHRDIVDFICTTFK